MYFLIQTSSPDSSNENSPATPPDEQGQGDAPPQLEDEEPAFPHTDLAKLDDMINRYLYIFFRLCANLWLRLFYLFQMKNIEGKS